MEDIENILRKIKDLMDSKPKTLDFLIDEKNKKIKSISALTIIKDKRDLKMAENPRKIGSHRFSAIIKIIRE